MGVLLTEIYQLSIFFLMTPFEISNSIELQHTRETIAEPTEAEQNAIALLEASGLSVTAENMKFVMDMHDWGFTLAEQRSIMLFAMRALSQGHRE